MCFLPPRWWWTRWVGSLRGSLLFLKKKKKKSPHTSQRALQKNRQINRQCVGIPSCFQAVVAGIQQAHAEQLANMRIQDLNVSLKPLNSVNNPILRKRKLLGWDGFDRFFFFLFFIFWCFDIKMHWMKSPCSLQLKDVAHEQQAFWAPLPVCLTCTMLRIQTLLQPFSFMFLLCDTALCFYKTKHVWVSTPQPQAQWQFLHPRPRERRERLQHRSGKTQRRHRTMYTSTSWSVLAHHTHLNRLTRHSWDGCGTKLYDSRVFFNSHWPWL